MNKTALFQPFGLDKKTELVYRALLTLADAPASRVARHTAMRRTSVYHILENLIALGLATSYTQRGTRRFVAEHPSRLKTFFERQAILAERMIPELEKEISKTGSGYAARIFEGREAIKQLSELALHAKDKAFLSVGSTKKLLAFFGGKYGFGKRRRKLGIFHRAIRLQGDEVNDAPDRFHQIRILPESISFPGYMLLFDTSVGIIPLADPPRGILITDRVYAAMMRSVFEVFWGLSRAPQK